MVKMKKLSIVIPCYNEEEGLKNLSEQLDPVITKLREEFLVELILVNDGSTDNTLKKMAEFFIDKAKIISYCKNRNLGGALKEGFKHITGDIIITMDSDCTYSPKEIIPLLSSLDEKTDVVTASPYHPKGKVENVPKYRLLLSRTISLIYGMILGEKLYTYTAMFRAYKREVIDNVKIKNNGFIGVTELLLFSILKGYKVKEFPTTLHSRMYGISKIKLLKTIKEHIILILDLIKLKGTKKK
jgi:dolichol-phosphate mannosyltransferase